MGLLKQLFERNKKEKAADLNILSLNRELEILNDCAKLIETTKNPKTFFNRYELYMDKLSLLADAESSNLVKVTGESFVKKYIKMNKKEQRIHSINNFIDRMWNDTLNKVNTLKTDKGKQNKITLFFKTLSEYENLMPPECIEYYKSLSNSKQINNSDRAEYDAWLDFLGNGGTTEEWDEMKANKTSRLTNFQSYLKELNPVADQYFPQLQKIEKDWLKLYHSKNYSTSFAKEYEKLCLENIKLYIKLVHIEKKYGEYTSKSVPAYKRLIMLYERQGNFDRAIEACKHALLNEVYNDGISEKLKKLIKKANRKPTTDEINLISNAENKINRHTS